MRPWKITRSLVVYQRIGNFGGSGGTGSNTAANSCHVLQEPSSDPHTRHPASRLIMDPAYQSKAGRGRSLGVFDTWTRS
jgi:hypothetical protein